MKQNKPTLILLEGHIGSGKSTTSTLIREKLSNYTLYRLTGLPSDTDTASKTYFYHSNILCSIEDCSFLGANFVLDRTFISNLVYTRMDNKDYSFELESETLCYTLRRIANKYDVYFINLYCSNDGELERRLGGRNKFQYVSHHIEQAKKQRDEYHKYFEEKKDLEYLTVKEIDTTRKSSNEVLKEIVKIIGGE